VLEGVIPLETYPLVEWHYGELAGVPSCTVLKTQICVTRPQCVKLIRNPSLLRKPYVRVVRTACYLAIFSDSSTRTHTQNLFHYDSSYCCNLTYRAGTVQFVSGQGYGLDNWKTAVRCLLCSFQTVSKAHPGSIRLHAGAEVENLWSHTFTQEKCSSRKISKSNFWASFLLA